MYVVYQHSARADWSCAAVGVVNQLEVLQSAIQSTDLHQKMQKCGTVWIFNPPAAPHRGGVREALVTSAKWMIYQILAGADVNDEKLLILTLWICYFTVIVYIIVADQFWSREGGHGEELHIVCSTSLDLLVLSGVSKMLLGCQFEFGYCRKFLFFIYIYT